MKLYAVSTLLFVIAGE